MIFLDMDDTLLKSDLTISKKNEEAIRAAVDRGIHVVLCTGRAIYSIQKYITALGLDRQEGYAICLNGSTIYSTKTGSLLMEKLFYKNTYRSVLEAAHEYDIDIQCYHDKDFYLEKITDTTFRYSEKMNAAVQLVEDMLSMDCGLSKILLNGEHEKLVKLRDTINGTIEGHMNCFFSKPEFLEFTPTGATKGETMVHLASSLGIDADELIAVGDSFNDIHMIEMAGLGVAVQNAADDIKRAADYITQRDNENDAIAEVIYKFILPAP